MLSPTEQSLQQLNVVARLIAPRWVRQFLFTTDPIQTTVLTSPLALDNAVTARRVESNFIRSQNPSEPFAIQAQSETVIAPFIAIDGFITGIGVRELFLKPLFTNSDLSPRTSFTSLGTSVESERATWPMAEGTIEHSRFVNILGGQVALFVRTRPQALHYVFIEAFDFQSRTSRTRTNFIFHAKDLRRITMPSIGTNESLQKQAANASSDAVDDIPPKANDLHTALALVQVIVEHCACQNCPFQPRCTCGPRKIVPAFHAYDVRAFRESATRQDGIFRGIEVFSRCTSEVQILSAKLGVEHRGHTGRDRGIISRCVNWAIANSPEYVSLGVDRPVLYSQKFPSNDDLRSLSVRTNGTPGINGFLDSLIVRLNKDIQLWFPNGNPKEGEDKSNLDCLKNTTPLVNNVINQGRKVDRTTHGGDGCPKNNINDMHTDKSGDRVKRQKPGARKERSPYSARKSIGAQKIRGEELKKSIDSLQEYMMRLSERERALRVENSRMRAAYSRQIHAHIHKGK